MANTLTVRLAETAWNGDAQFTLTVDGVQIAGPTSVTTPEGSGYQEFTYSGDYGAGPHTVAVNFINDAWGGSTATDRNLYVNGIVFDGTFYAGQTAANNASNGGADIDPNAAEMNVNGTTTFTNVINGSSPPPPPPPSSGPDTLVVYASAFSNPNKIAAGFTVTVDGTAVTGPYSLHRTASDFGIVGDSAMTFSGNFGAGPHTVDIHFNSDAQQGTGVSPGFSFYGIDFNGQHYNVGAAENDVPGSTTDPRAITSTSVGGDVIFRNVAEGTSAPNVTLNDHNVLYGGAGDDLLQQTGPSSSREANGMFGGAGSDTFVVIAGTGGKSVHFQSGAGGDVIDLVGYGYTSFADVMAHMTSTGGGSILTNPNGEKIAFFDDYPINGASPTPDTFIAANFILDGATSSVADQLVLHVSEDAWNGDAEFAVRVDGKQIGTVLTATASHAQGQVNNISLVGHFGAGPHTVEVQFLNDGYGGSTAADRNMYVEGITFNGVDYAGQTAQNTATGGSPETDPNAAEMFTNGTVTFSNVAGGGTGGGGGGTTGQHLVGTAGNDSLTGGTGNDTIEGLGGDDTINGGAGDDVIFTDAGHDRVIETAGSSGNDTVHFTVGAGGDVMDLRTFGYTGLDDVRAHMTALTGGGTLLRHANGESVLFLNEGAQSIRDITPINFTADNFVLSDPTPPPGPDTLVLHLSEDAYNGDAQFLLFVDGVQIAGPTSVTTPHGSGFQDFTYSGNFGAGPHSVDIRFINDAWGGSATTDRNMYVGGITFNGVNYAGQTATDTAMGGAPENDPNAAEMFTNGDVTFNNVGSPSGGGGGGGGTTPPPSGVTSTVVIHASEDAWNGDAQFLVFINGVQQGGVQTVTASHSAGQTQDFTFTGDYGLLGPSTVAVQFINDAWGGSASTDRNLYVSGIDVNGVVTGNHFFGSAAKPSATEMDVNSTAVFTLVTYGDTSGNLSNSDHAGAQSLSGTDVTIVGDAYGLFGHAAGGDDNISASDGTLNAIYTFGDAATISDDAIGGNDTLHVGANVFRGFGFGDSLTLSGNAHGGNDSVDVVGRSSATAYGDAQTISGFAKGGNDHVDTFSRFGSISYGDAETITDHGRGGDDVVSGTVSSSPVMPELYGDAHTLSGFAIGGNDTLSGGHAKMYGDGYELLDSAVGGNDTLFATTDMWGDAAVVAAGATTGADIFVFDGTSTFGNTTIHDFQPGKDHIEIKNYAGIASFADLQSHISDTSGGAMITFDSTNTTLVANDHNLTASDFIFG